MMYKLIKEIFKDSEFGEYTSYGIISDSGFKISDISLEKSEVETLLLKINKRQTPIYYLSSEIDSFFRTLDITKNRVYSHKKRNIKRKQT